MAQNVSDATALGVSEPGPGIKYARAEMWSYRGVPEVRKFELNGLTFEKRGDWYYYTHRANGLTGPYDLHIGTDGTFNMYRMFRED